MSSSYFFRTRAEAARHEYQQNGLDRLRFDYFGKSSGLQFGPEAHLADLPREDLVRAHYHSVDQFQVLFGDGGAIYKNDPVPRVLLHYTDSYTTYGPIRPGTDRLRFLTLRAASSDVTAYMPESRDQLPKAERRRRQALVNLEPWLDKPPAADGQVVVDGAWADDTQAVSCQVLAAGSGASVQLPPAQSPGRYCIVLDGDLIDDDGRSLGPLAIGWSQPVTDTTTITLKASTGLTAGRAGCRALLLQFPPPAAPTPAESARG